ncbi:hypothetical protein LguiB_010912 [Lonicera macranthoides]
MGVGGHFWDLLKPYAQNEGFDFIRNKRVAVDLSFWIVQHETAIKGYSRNPHIRLTFFRTINLFSKFGAFPVFVVDGTPSPLKSQARILRFFRASGIDLSNLPVAEEGISVERNRAFTKCVRECVELLELLGMPVLKARGEAEALCAQLNREGHVDACITADSDAFLFGAECVIKHIRPNTKDPFECYNMPNIEAGLGLKRKHLIVISLLVGNDHDLNGVQGIGLDTALRFVKSFTEDEVLNRLHEIGRGDTLHFQSGIIYGDDVTPRSGENSRNYRLPHCSFCGHPGSKRVHIKFACEYCTSSTSMGCTQKPAGFKCNCSSCDLTGQDVWVGAWSQERKEKEQKKNENWQIKVCKKIATQENFPNDEIIKMYLNKNQGNFIGGGPLLSWESPKTEMLVDYLAYHQQWDPSYIRQRMVPMLSTIFLREMACNPTNDLLYGQYEFDSVRRVKIRYGHQYYVVNWKKACAMGSDTYSIPSEVSDVQSGPAEHDNFIDPLDEPNVPHHMGPAEHDNFMDLSDEPNVPQVHVDDGHLFLLTDEDMELVRAAFPVKVDQFLQEKELKSRRKKTSSRSKGTPKNSESQTSRTVQLSIKEFYRSSKLLCQAKGTGSLAETSDSSSDSSKGKRNASSQNFSKSARRRLLFG